MELLLLVAPVEHKVRIEVGYGLEGTLTDALSSVIISSAIIPRFKVNDYSGGIERGVDAIISVLTTDASAWHQRVNVRSDEPSSAFNKLFHILLIAFYFFNCSVYLGSATVQARVLGRWRIFLGWIFWGRL